jgi:hypothetical protein
LRDKEIRHDNLAELVKLYESQTADLRLAIDAKTRSASIAESKAALYRSAYEAEAAAHQAANADLRSMGASDTERLLWMSLGAVAVALGAWSMAQLSN